jgi:GT2 family glycosyltransferase
MISVIIPTYKEPEALEVCLRSAVTGQRYQNQIIVVVDGYYELNKKVLEKFKNSIEVLILEDNVGLCRATNLGVYNASFDLVFIVNDDNVFPTDWDTNLIKHYQPKSVLTPNQIEPTPSIFKQFILKNLGRDPKTFNLLDFLKYELEISRDIKEETGGTLPFLISKKDYLTVGGWDESYPGPWVVDWEFFMKCELIGLKMLRTYKCHFYHFVSIGTENTPEEKLNKQNKELECHKYFQYKWGYPAKINFSNNSHI